MIFVDSNVPMYLVGVDHDHKFAARRALERLATERRRLVTSSEVFQELLHRYGTAAQRDGTEMSFAVLRGLVDTVLPVDEADVLAAKDLLFHLPRLSARDALHVAVMRHHEIEEILSFDAGFDRVPGVTRLMG